MRQLVQSARSGRVEIVELPDPVPGPKQVLVRTRWSLISPGTEHAVSRTASKGLIGKARERPDQAREVIRKVFEDGPKATTAAVRARLDDLLTPGYTSMGVVERVGGGVEDLKPGARVGCFGANVACHAELVVVPAPLCMPLPEALDDQWGAFGAVGAIASHAVRVGRIESGEIVVVLGTGLVGQLAAQLATAAGARTLVVDPSPERVEIARGLGAVGGAVLGDDDVDQLVRRHSEGRGADVVIIAAATPSDEPIEVAAKIARDRATVVAVGDVGLNVPRRPFYDKELQLRVSRSYGPGRYDHDYEIEGRDYPPGYVRWTERRLVRYFFEEVAADRVRLGPLVTHRFEIGEGDAAYEALADPSRMGILLEYGKAPPPPCRRAPVSSRRSAVTRGRTRVALIGPGKFARSTLLPLLSRTDAELVAVVGSSPASTLAAARRWNADSVATDPDEVLADDAVDVVVLATRHDSHAELAAAALQAGKGVFLEKPLAIDERGLSSLIPLLKERGSLFLDFNRGFAPTTQALISHFHDRSDPIAIAYRVNAGEISPDHWLRDPLRGGGRLVGEGCHFVDFCSQVVDRPLKSINVRGLGTGPTTPSGDSFVLGLDYTDGSVATVEYIATGASRLGKERVEVMGGGRAAVLDDFRSLELYTGHRRLRRGSRRPWRRRDKGHAGALETAFRFFAQGGDPPLPYERIFETTRATFAAREALEQGDEAPRPLS